MSVDLGSAAPAGSCTAQNSIILIKKKQNKTNVAPEPFLSLTVFCDSEPTSMAMQTFTSDPQHELLRADGVQNPNQTDSKSVSRKKNLYNMCLVISLRISRPYSTVVQTPRNSSCEGQGDVFFSCTRGRAISCSHMGSNINIGPVPGL